MPTSTLSCPGGHTKRLVAIQYVDGLDAGIVVQEFRLVDVTNGVSALLSDIERVVDTSYDLDTTLPQ